MAVLITPQGILSYPALFTPKAFGDEPPRFSATIVFSLAEQKTEAFKALKAAAKLAIINKFGEAKAANKAFVAGLRDPFRDGEEKYTEGDVYLNLASKTRVGVVDANVQPIIDPSLVWAGQLARASVSCFAYDRLGNKGVSFGLEGIQIIKADMPRLDGRVPAEKAFSPIVGDDDDTANLV